MLTEAERKQLSPMMQKYLETKEEYPDCILFYRLGDFYEMFFEDAEIGARVLELTLTGKECGLDHRAPMCGVPYHAVDAYITKMVQAGYRVAIGEQMEDPRFAKGLVKREVTRVVTPGTIMASEALDSTRNNYLMCIAFLEGALGLAVTDITTGAFFVTEVSDAARLIDEVSRYAPSEIVYNAAFSMSGVDLSGLKDRGVMFAEGVLDAASFEEDRARRLITQHFGEETADKGFAEYPMGTLAAGALLSYLHQTQKSALGYLTVMTTYETARYMVLDQTARRNLEITETLRDKTRKGSLLWVLDKTCTAMGARHLRSWLEQPLMDQAAIEERLDTVEALTGEYVAREELREYLNPIYDLERLSVKICSGTAGPKDLIAFAKSLRMLPPIRGVLTEFHHPRTDALREQIDELADVESLITRAIDEDAPVLVKDGGIIKTGYSEEVDLLRRSQTEGKTWISELEAAERERTGIRTLRIRYNKVFGYYLEVTNSFKDKVPEDYVRKQTLTGAERYITPRLKELEEMILGAEERLGDLEYKLFTDVREAVAAEIDRITKTTQAVASLDAFASLAAVAAANRYVRPQINHKGIIRIKDGRHPVVEQMTRDGSFVANDTYLDNKDNRVAIITGPNMAGKSTYMRQAALIVLMAQVGSFVPAAEADIGICDRIFTRVGASDDLASGQSTFMLEMNEVADILKNATRNSLLILDEIGRGTSTFDGMSIAWAVLEYIADKQLVGAKTLFATHYHELTELEGTLPGVHNYCIAVKEQGEEIVFLRKIITGGADKSYGIQVARLAGLPERVLTRAKELVGQLSDADINVRARELVQEAGGKKKAQRSKEAADDGQLSLFEEEPKDDLLEEIKRYDLAQMTPFEAMNALYSLQTRLKKR